MLKPVPSPLNIVFSYAEITRTTTAGITWYMQAARRSAGFESLVRKEIAYGIYIGWQTLVEGHSNQATYLSDDVRLKALLIL